MQVLGANTNEGDKKKSHIKLKIIWTKIIGNREYQGQGNLARGNVQKISRQHVEREGE